MEIQSRAQGRLRVQGGVGGHMEQPGGEGLLLEACGGGLGAGDEAGARVRPGQGLSLAGGEGQGAGPVAGPGKGDPGAGGGIASVQAAQGGDAGDVGDGAAGNLVVLAVVQGGEGDQVQGVGRRDQEPVSLEVPGQGGQEPAVKLPGAGPRVVEGHDGLAVAAHLLAQPGPGHGDDLHGDHATPVQQPDHEPAAGGVVVGHLLLAKAGQGLLEAGQGRAARQHHAGEPRVQGGKLLLHPGQRALHAPDLGGCGFGGLVRLLRRGGSPHHCRARGRQLALQVGHLPGQDLGLLQGEPGGAVAHQVHQGAGAQGLAHLQGSVGLARAGQQVHQLVVQVLLHLFHLGGAGGAARARRPMLDQGDAPAELLPCLLHAAPGAQGARGEQVEPPAPVGQPPLAAEREAPAGVLQGRHMARFSLVQPGQTGKGLELSHGRADLAAQVRRAGELLAGGLPASELQLGQAQVGSIHRHALAVSPATVNGQGGSELIARLGVAASQAQGVADVVVAGRHLHLVAQRPGDAQGLVERLQRRVGAPHGGQGAAPGVKEPEPEQARLARQPQPLIGGLQ